MLIQKELYNLMMNIWNNIGKEARIVSSPYKRAIETSEIIAETIGIPIVTNEKIIEFDSGILAGNTHKENAELYPEYYRIWLERKDLDGIPGAEKGNELQARTLAFLMEYYEKEEFVDIVVSHAGFLRTLINTAKGLPRTTPVDSRNGAINIIDNPFEHIKSTEETMKITKRIDPNIDEDYITYLMKYRIFKGLRFFAENRNVYTEGNKKASNEILRKYFFAAEKLEMYRANKKFININRKIEGVTTQKEVQSNEEKEI